VLSISQGVISAHTNGRVADPYSFDTDPDPNPAFSAEYRSGSRGFDDQKLKKFTAEKNFFISKTTIYLGLYKGRPSYKISLQLSKKNIQYFKTCNFYFCG
jgi:hypothetical protein